MRSLFCRREKKGLEMEMILSICIMLQFFSCNFNQFFTPPTLAAANDVVSVQAKTVAEKKERRLQLSAFTPSGFAGIYQPTVVEKETHSRGVKPTCSIFLDENHEKSLRQLLRLSSSSKVVSRQTIRTKPFEVSLRYGLCTGASSI